MLSSSDKVSGKGEKEIKTAPKIKAEINRKTGKRVTKGVQVKIAGVMRRKETR